MRTQNTTELEHFYDIQADFNFCQILIAEAPNIFFSNSEPRSIIHIYILHNLETEEAQIYILIECYL